MKPSDNNSPAQLFKDASDRAKQKHFTEALWQLGEIIRNHPLSPDELDKAGKLLAKWTAAAPPVNVQRIDVLLLGQCTTSWIATALPAIAWGQGIFLRVRNGEYDNVMQELMVSPGPDSAPKIVILVPWTERLFFDPHHRSAQQRIDEELGFWKQAWNLIARNHAAKILQVGYDWISPGPLGHHLSATGDGQVAVVRRMNDALRNNLPPGAFFVDLEQVSGGIGRNSFYDPRRYFWTKQPFSELGVAELARHLWSGVRALMYGPKKVLVLDLDNTLWGGIVGETGPHGIALGETPDGEAFRAFQKHVKELSERGVVLAIASKNNRDDALSPFEQNSEMLLRLKHFAHIEAHWDSKVLSLRRIAQTLGLGLESFVFFDDNPAERELVRQSLPEVAVVDVPVDPADYTRALQSELWFETVALLESDLQRTSQYQQECKRRDSEIQFTSMEEYLKSLAMTGVIKPIDETNIHRVVQLLSKTNQFNVTTRRHSLEEVREMLSLPGTIGLTLSLRDRFGDHGLVSVLIAIPDAACGHQTLRIDTWLMSCRVIARTAEHFFFNALADRASKSGWEALQGEFIPTPKNELIAGLYESLGFERLTQGSEATVLYRQPLAFVRAAPTLIHGEDPNGG